MACQSACNSWEWEADPSLFESSPWCGAAAAAGIRKQTVDSSSSSSSRASAGEAGTGNGSSICEKCIKKGVMEEAAPPVEEAAPPPAEEAAKTEELSGGTRHSGSSGDSLTGLQLGKRVYSKAAIEAQRSKKSRSVLRTPRCQVQGCHLDLTSSKEYHRRHKVCEPHSKSVKVFVSSLEQRFCQQCSRFHPLAEFDDAKRSCRRRLAGHNERRRKPQPDPLTIQARLSPLEGWPYLHHDKFSSSRASLFPRYGDFRLPRHGDQLTYDYTIQLPMAMERHLYPRGLPLLTNDALPLRHTCTTTSSSALMPIAINNNTTTSVISNNLTLATTSSMPLADHGEDAFSGFGIGMTTPPPPPPPPPPPLSCPIERVPEYGRALSLLSLQTRSSPAPHTASPEPWCLLSDGTTTTTTDHHHHHHHHSNEPIAPHHWLLQAQDHQPQSHVFSVENMIHYMTSKAQSQQQDNTLGYEEDGALRSPVHHHHDYEIRLQGSSSSKLNNLESSASNKSILTTMPYLWNDGSSSGRAS